jgi:hypothetical protein
LVLRRSSAETKEWSRAVQADIEYRHQQLVREAKEYRRARQATAQSESAPKARLRGLRGIRSHYRRAA